MSELLEECVNDVGLRFKRKKKTLEKKDSSSGRVPKHPQQLIKEKELPPKKPILIDLKKSLAKLETIPKKLEKNEEVAVEKTQTAKNTGSEQINSKPQSYPKLPNKGKLNLDFDNLNKEVFPEFRWIHLVKEIAIYEFNRVKDVYKSNPVFLVKCKSFYHFF